MVQRYRPKRIPPKEVVKEITGENRYIDEGMSKWIICTARQNYWRVAGWYELDDLIQDGFMCYARCKEKYSHLTIKRHPLHDDRGRFMRFVKVAFVRHIHSLATKRTMCQEDLTSEGELPTPLAVHQQNEGPLASALSNAPQEVLALLKLLGQDCSEVVPYDWFRLRRRKIRETTNEYWCRRLGLDPKEINLVEMTKAVLKPEDYSLV